MSEGGFHCTPRHFRSQAEFERWLDLRVASFSSWYCALPAEGTPSAWDRWHANAEAALFPDHFLELRDEQAQPVGYLATVPGYWTGAPEGVQTFDHISQALRLGESRERVLTAAYALLVEGLRQPAWFERLFRGLRQRRTERANAIFLLAMMVDPQLRGRQLPTHLLSAMQATARRLGCDYVAAPFRPSHYGAYKAERRAAHSDALFLEYAALTDASGLPADPWLRNVVRQGARLVHPMPRALSQKRPLARFEAFKRRHRPDDWYSPAPDIWECGETCTWYIDRVQRVVLSWEPNYWGVFDLRTLSANPDLP